MPVVTQPYPTEERSLAVALALPAVMLLRDKVGCRLLSPRTLIAGAGAEVLLPEGGNFLFGDHVSFYALVGIGAAVAGFGFWQRRKHIVEIQAGTSSTHPYDIGVSRLARFFKLAPGRVNRFIDPLVTLGGGWLVSMVSPALGGTLMVSAGALAVCEWGAHRNSRQEMIDTHENFQTGERQRRVAEKVGPKLDAVTPQESEGTPSGVDDDIEWHLRRRG